MFYSRLVREQGKPTSPAEMSSFNSIYHKAVNGADIEFALTGATSELTNSKGK